MNVSDVTVDLLGGICFILSSHQCVTNPPVKMETSDLVHQLLFKSDGNIFIVDIFMNHGSWEHIVGANLFADNTNLFI